MRVYGEENILPRKDPARMNQLREKHRPDSGSPKESTHLFLRIFSNLALPPLIIFVLFLVIGFGFLIPLLEETFTRQKYDLCRRMVESVISSLHSRHQDYLDGRDTLEDAQGRAIHRMRHLRFGEGLKDYYWIIDERGYLLMHPYRQDMENRDPSTVHDPGGKLLQELLLRMREVVKNQNGGFLQYEWQWMDDPHRVEPKISYVQHFEPWNWIIGTGVYVEDIRAELATWRNRLVGTEILLMSIACGVALFLSLRALKLQKRELQALRKIQDNEKKFRGVFDTAPYGISLHHLETGAIIEANHALGMILGVSPEELLGKNPMKMGTMLEEEMFRSTLTRLLEGHPVLNASHAIRLASGEERHILYSLAPLALEEQTLAIAVTVDVTEQHLLTKSNAELQEKIRSRSRDLQHLDELLRKRQDMVEKVQHQMALLDKTFEHVSEGIYISDKDRHVLTVNPAFTTITGYSLEDLDPLGTSVLRADLHTPEFYEEIDRRLQQEHCWEGELWGRRKNGEPYPLYLILTALMDRGGNVTHYIGVIQDRSEIHQSRIELEHETLHDSLTKLPNRVLFLDRLTMACRHAEESRSNFAVLLLGLDRFSHINKSLGYAAGDELLIQAASRMETVLPETATLARFGGDEFVACIPFPKNVRQALRLAEELIQTLRLPFTLQEHEVRITASAGISIYPQDATTPENLLKNASLALGRAKHESRNWYQLFTEDMNEHMQIRHDVENELRKGISEQEFFMYYQPKLHAATKRVVGSEALMRWIRPGKGIISPVTFIPLAEEIGEIVSLGKMAMSTACKQAREWNAQGHPLQIAVNVSPQQFSDNAFSASVLEAIEKAQVDPATVELEITESAFMTNLSKAVRIMKDLQKEGIRFSLDDFGTGYSSLSYIHHLPLSGIKVDRSLTFDLHTNADTRAIISTLAFMARELGLELTVEGVETQEQLQFIQSLGNDLMVQGYLFSPPLPPEEFLRYLQKNAS